jgi:RNA polymerase sporulation-specific sigma factor
VGIKRTFCAVHSLYIAAVVTALANNIFGGDSMNHHEIESCVIRAKSGNQEDLLKILEQYKPFIYKTANQFNIKNYDTYDLLQIGYISLINAVTKYKTGSYTFSSYAFNSIKNAFKYTARQNSKYAEDLSLNIPVDTEGPITTEFIDCIEGDENLEEHLISSEKTREVRNAVAKLQEDELELVLMVYYSGASLKTYADKKGITYLQALVRRNKILQKLSRSIKS